MKQQSIIDLIGWFLLAAFIYMIGALCSCNLPTVFNPPIDWAYHPPEIDSIPIDTIPQDTIVPPDTCTGYIEYADPAFVGLYVKFDEPQDSILWQGGGISSHDLGEVVQHITSLPFTFGTSPIGAWVIIKGTNNHSQFQTKIFARDNNGAKWYFGTGKQFLMLCGSDPSSFKVNINLYPSFDFISFYGTDFDSIEYVNLCREVLKDCHAGRWYADLYFCPFQLEQSLIDSFYLAGWERVRTH